MIKIDDSYKNVVVSSGTLRDKGIINNVKDFNNILRNITLTILIEDFELGFGDYVVNDIFEYLNKIAPDGYYFGNKHRDGALFGFWEYPAQRK